MPTARGGHLVLPASTILEQQLVTRIYLDPDAVTIEGGGSPDSSDQTPDDEALRALGYLVDAGHEVVVVAPGGQDPSAGHEPSGTLRAIARETVAEVPES